MFAIVDVPILRGAVSRNPGPPFDQDQQTSLLYRALNLSNTAEVILAFTSSIPHNLIIQIHTVDHTEILQWMIVDSRNHDTDSLHFDLTILRLPVG